jgi:hypothetical protein
MIGQAGGLQGVVSCTGVTSLTTGGPTQGVVSNCSSVAEEDNRGAAGGGFRIRKETAR